MSKALHPLALEHAHFVDAAAARQTIKESKITHKISLTDGVTVLHGTRDGLPVVIVQIENQKPGELSAVWFDETAEG